MLYRHTKLEQEDKKRPMFTIFRQSALEFAKRIFTINMRITPKNTVDCLEFIRFYNNW